MAFRFKVRQPAVLKNGHEDADGPVNVLVLSQVTEKTFAQTHYSYKVVDEDGCQFLVDEGELEKQAVVDEDKGGDEEPVDPAPPVE